MNFNLAANSIGFYQISKLFCIPLTLFLETLLGRRQQNLTIKMNISLLLIISGMGLVAVNEVSVNLIGTLWALSAVLSVALAQIYFGPLQKDLDLNAIQMLFHLSPVMMVGSIIAIPLLEDSKKLIEFDITETFLIDVAISSGMAVINNLTNFVVLSITSPITYQVIGHLKTIFILISGIFLYDKLPNVKSSIGMVLAMLGVILYTEENRQQQLQRKNTTPIPTPIPNNINNKGNLVTASSTVTNSIEKSSQDNLSAV